MEPEDNGNTMNPWSRAWRTHRQELLPGIFAAFVYFILAKDVEPSRYTFLLLAILIITPPLVLFRIIYTANVKRPEEEKKDD